LILSNANIAKPPAIAVEITSIKNTTPNLTLIFMFEMCITYLCYRKISARRLLDAKNGAKTCCLGGLPQFDRHAGNFIRNRLKPSARAF